MALKKCKECGTQVSSSAKTCPNCGKKLKHTGLIIFTFIFVIILAFVSGCIVKEYIQPGTSVISAISRNIGFDLPWNNYKTKTITAENYDEIMDEVGEKMKDDDNLYYASYSILYYITQDGMAQAFNGDYNEQEMYKRIYGKNIKKLIEEGKQLMKDNNVTLEEYKKSLDDLSQLGE